MMDINDLLKDEKGNSFIDMNKHSDWIKFFLIFSRFEYALKRSRYANRNEKYVEANWNCFANETEEIFSKQKSEDLEKAITYLGKNPPKKQVMKNGKLDWGCPKEGKGDIHNLINAVKRVRNNLFHGGKFPTPTGPVEDPTRDNELITHSITILKHLLNSSKEVREKYFEPLE